MSTEKQITELDERIMAAYAVKDALKKRKMITCTNCNHKTQISKASIVRDHHYITPHGCTEGDYWLFSKEYHYYCNKCDGWSRAYIMNWETIEERAKNPDYMKSLDIERQKKDDNRVKLYYLIHNNIQYFNEVLDSYNDNGTITELRAKHKEREERKKDLVMGECW